MRTSPRLAIEALDASACAPYGVMLGTAAREDDPSTFLSRASDFWRAHLFDAGGGSPAEILWVVYRERLMAVSTLEAHHLTQQAIVPLTGSIIQILAISDKNGRPDPNSLRAFRIAQGQGICMHPNTWHATRVSDAEVTCLMLTRGSTTRELAISLRTAAPPLETSLCEIGRVSLTA